MNTPIRRFGIECMDDFKSDRLARLLEYWQSKCDGRQRPKWSEIGLMDIYELTPFLVVKDLAEDASTFSYRFWGTGVRQFLGYDMTGKTAREHYADDPLIMTTEKHIELLSQGIPVISTGTVLWEPGQEYKHYVALLLPLDGEDAPLQHLMIGFDFTPAR